MLLNDEDLRCFLKARAHAKRRARLRDDVLLGFLALVILWAIAVAFAFAR